MSVSKLFENGKRPNVLMIITDQERSLQHWPENFCEDHLPNMSRLKNHGLEFLNYFTNSCMCSPSRASLLTGQFPIQTGVTMTGSPKPPRALPRDITNLANIFQQAGYHCEWHGKWHLGGKPSDYGFQGWQPPDAGNYLSLNDTLGGGDPNNDGRFLESILNFLKEAASETTEASKPFLLVASFVNPHDVYVAQHKPTLGYTTDDFHRVAVPMPTNWEENPDTNFKPRAQAQMSLFNVPFYNSPEEYVNFYAYLHTIVDAQIGLLLDELDRTGMTNDTLILRTSDHGEQALSHSLVEKFYNVYEESIHIPLIVSNPIAFPTAVQTNALASHIDLLPTLQNLLRIQSNTSSQSIPIPDLSDCVGNDLTPIFDTPAKAVQTRIHFTYDDIPCRGAPSVIRSLRTPRYKYAVYFTPDGRDADWELYDLKEDSLENRNIAGHAQSKCIQEELEKDLVQTMKAMRTFPTMFEWPPRSTRYSQGVLRKEDLSAFGCRTEKKV